MTLNSLLADIFSNQVRVLVIVGTLLLIVSRSATAAAFGCIGISQQPMVELKASISNP